MPYRKDTNFGKYSMWKGTQQQNFRISKYIKVYHRSVRPTGLMSHRYPCGSLVYLEEGVRGNGRGRLTNACIVGILRGDKKKRMGSRKQRSENRQLESRVVRKESKARIVNTLPTASDSTAYARQTGSSVSVLTLQYHSFRSSRTVSFSNWYKIVGACKATQLTQLSKVPWY